MRGLLGMQNHLFTVARGPVPRDRPRALVTVVRDRLIPNRSRSGELPTENGLYRSAGPVPRDLPTETKNARSKGPGRLLSRPGHGEGQALALRWEEGCFR